MKWLTSTGSSVPVSGGDGGLMPHVAPPAVLRRVGQVEPPTIGWSSARRREEISRLNRTDIQDGRAADGLVTSKGNKDRVVFFDDSALEAIRTYLAARGDFLGGRVGMRAENR